MGFFNIFKGHSSRIDLNTTPFHDGNVYLTTDDGGFYIDAENDGEQKRIRINPPSSGGGTTRKEINVVLPSSGWSNGSQTISVPGMTSGATVVVGGDLGSEPEYSDCGVYCRAQDEGTLTFISDWTPDTDLVANVLFFT